MIIERKASNVPAINDYVEKFNSLERQMKELKQEIEKSPSQMKIESVVSGTIDKINQLDHSNASLIQEKEKMANSQLGPKKRGDWKVIAAIVFAVICWAISIIAWIADSFYGKDKTKNNKNWEIVKITFTGAGAISSGIAGVVGVLYEKYKQRAEELNQLQPEEIDQIKRLLPFLESLKNVEKIKDQSLHIKNEKETKKELQTCLKNYQNVPKDVKKKYTLPKLARMVVIAVKLLPKDHAARQKLKQIEENSDQLSPKKLEANPMDIKEFSDKELIKPIITKKAFRDSRHLSPQTNSLQKSTKHKSWTKQYNDEKNSDKKTFTVINFDKAGTPNSSEDDSYPEPKKTMKIQKSSGGYGGYVCALSSTEDEDNIPALFKDLQEYLDIDIDGLEFKDKEVFFNGATKEKPPLQNQHQINRNLDSDEETIEFTSKNTINLDLLHENK